MKKRTQANTGNPKRKRAKWGSSKSPLRTSKTRQAEVAAMYLSGATQREISRELELDLETVPRILSQPEIELLINAYRSVVLKKIAPKALIGAHELVRRVDGQMITNVLRGARVFVDRHEVATVQVPVQDYSYSRIRFFGKYKRWPTDEEAVKFQKTITVKPIVKGELTE